MSLFAITVMGYLKQNNIIRIRGLMYSQFYKFKGMDLPEF